MAEQFSGQYKDALENDAKQTLQTTDNFSVKTNSWRILRVMAGAFYKLSIVPDRLYFKPGVMIGILKTSVPAYSFYDTTSYSFSGNISKSSLPVAFCYEIGSALEWSFTKRAFISVDIEFYHAVPKGFTLGGTDVHENAKVPISSLNSLLGIGYRL